MQSKRIITAREREHVARIKGMPCCVCGERGPSIAHHVKQSSHYYTVPLCESCHVGQKNGIHGQRDMWRLAKMDETDALVRVIESLACVK